MGNVFEMVFMFLILEIKHVFNVFLPDRGKL